MSTPAPTAADFLKISSQFRLGELPTESRHPKTKNLSALSQNDLEAALRLIHQVEVEALDAAFANAVDDIRDLARAMRTAWDQGGRVFFSGCGATGRLSVSLEAFWRKECAANGWTTRYEDVVSFIAGGDYALVRSIENFEDHPEYGAQQLRDLGFGKKDLLVAITEGGETPFVIGSALEAATISGHPTWFLYCNPRASLMSLQRSREVFDHARIRNVSLPTGPMALTGSTRLQASTVLMLAAGAALFSAQDGGDPLERVDEFKWALKSTDFTVLAPLIAREAEAYAKGNRCLHAASEHAITVLTDTTERSPTFSIAPFENDLHPADRKAWTYLVIPHATTAKQAWNAVLMRAPRALTWASVAKKYDQRVVEGFNFSSEAISRRHREIGAPLVYSVESQAGTLQLSIGGRAATIPCRAASRMTEHLILKCALNMSSTLVMGRLGRFESNLMLFVKASNNKLIDRSIRFISLLLADRGHSFTYEEICHALFETRTQLDPEESIVLKTLARLTGNGLKDRSA